jgi:glycosyltransferase involved in cell wall biosynthesis
MRRADRHDQKITVAHFMPWSGVGGVEIATLRMTEATKDRFRHVAFCLEDAVSLKNSFEKLGIETISYAAPEPSLRHALRFYGESAIVARQIRRTGTHVVHFADEKAAYHCSLAALIAGTKRICHVRVSYPHFDIRHRLCLLPVQSFIFVSQEAKNTFALSLPARKARVIYDAVEVSAQDMTDSNTEVRSELGLPPECIIVGMVARVSPQKDYFTLATAAVEILRRYPNTRFLIVGDNSLVELNRNHYAAVTARLKELGIANEFIFTGHRSDVSRLIAAMDICVLCTHREGFPLSILESMAMQKPVVATAVGGIPEIVKPGITGYLHQHENSNELAGAILSLIENPQETSRIGQAAYAHVAQNYSRQMFADEISTAYSDVMNL